MTSISSALFKFFKARQMVEFNVIFRANKLAAGCSGAVTSTTRCGRVRKYSGIYCLEIYPFVRLSSCVDTVNIIIYLRLRCLWRQEYFQYSVTKSVRLSIHTNVQHYSSPVLGPEAPMKLRSSVCIFPYWAAQPSPAQPRPEMGGTPAMITRTSPTLS